MEYKRSSHVGEEEEEEEEEEEDEEEEDEEEEENRAHRYTTVAAAPVGASHQQQLQAQALGLGSAASHMSMLEAAAFSRPVLPPNSSLVTQTPTLPPPGFLPPHHRQPQQLHPRRAERERERAGHGGGQQPQHRRHQESARNGVLGGGGTAPPQTSTLGAAVGAVEPAQWRYRECLRNHAARLGAHVLDGCCEFMPSAGEGAAALACAACGCHRSFHRREAVPGGVAPAAVAVSPSPATPTANSSRVMPLLLAPPHMQTRPHVPASPSSAPAALTESSSEELRGPAPAHPAPPPAHPPHAQLAVGGSASAPPVPSKKRFRTKFTAEQKDRMREFAHRVGWRIHKPDSDAVDAFCAQVGVSRRVLKVWMHNNKHLAKMPPSSPSSQPPPPPLPHHLHEHHPPPPPAPHHHHHHPPPQQHHDA